MYVPTSSINTQGTCTIKTSYNYSKSQGQRNMVYFWDTQTSLQNKVELNTLKGGNC